MKKLFFVFILSTYVTVGFSQNTFNWLQGNCISGSKVLIYKIDDKTVNIIWDSDEIPEIDANSI